MSLLIGVGDFGIGALVTRAETAATTAEDAAEILSDVQAVGGKPVNAVADIAALQALMGADDMMDVFVKATKAKYLVTKTTVTAYAMLD